MAHPKWTPAVKLRLTDIQELEQYIAGIQWSPWRPSGMVLHNTGAPSLKQRPDGLTAQHIDNLEAYYRDDQRWSGAPHAFIDDHGWWIFNPLNKQGVHSPSFNGTHLGIELLGDYSVEDCDSGRGLKVKNNAIALFGTIHARLGLDPDRIKFHKDDPKTTHDCPGKKLYLEKVSFIEAVKEFMGSGGEHAPGDGPDESKAKPPAPKPRSGKVVNVPKGDVLNIRNESSARGRIVETLENGAQVQILGQAMNGPTKWLNVQVEDVIGWASARYIEELK